MAPKRVLTPEIKALHSNHNHCKPWIHHNHHALYATTKKAMTWSNHLGEYHHMEKEKEKKRRRQTQRGESLSGSNLQVKTKFFLHLFGQHYFTPASIHSWRRNMVAFCFLWACAIWNGTCAPDTAARGPLSIRRQQCLANTSQVRGAGQPPGLLACWWWRNIVVSHVNSKCQHFGAYSNYTFYSQLIPQHWNTEQLKPWLYLVSGISKRYLTTR